MHVEPHRRTGPRPMGRPAIHPHGCRPSSTWNPRKETPVKGIAPRVPLHRRTGRPSPTGLPASHPHGGGRDSAWNPRKGPGQSERAPGPLELVPLPSDVPDAGHAPWRGGVPLRGGAVGRGACSGSRSPAARGSTWNLGHGAATESAPTFECVKGQSCEEVPKRPPPLLSVGATMPWAAWAVRPDGGPRESRLLLAPSAPPDSRERRRRSSLERADPAGGSRRSRRPLARSGAEVARPADPEEVGSRPRRFLETPGNDAARSRLSHPSRQADPEEVDAPRFTWGGVPVDARTAGPAGGPRRSLLPLAPSGSSGAGPYFGGDTSGAGPQPGSTWNRLGGSSGASVSPPTHRRGFLPMRPQRSTRPGTETLTPPTHRGLLPVPRWRSL